jgi:hypothetical protein
VIAFRGRDRDAHRPDAAVGVQRKIPFGERLIAKQNVELLARSVAKQYHVNVHLKLYHAIHVGR